MSDDIPTDPTPPQDRARIELTPPPRKRDPLPILYLVGFCILAGALFYLYRHPTNPRGALQEAQQVNSLRQDMDTNRQALDAMAARLKAVEARPVPSAPDLGPLDARIARLEQRPVPQPTPPTDLGPVDTRLKALEARPLPPPAPDLAPLAARIDALDTKQAAAVAALSASVGTRLTQAEAGDKSRLDALEARLATLEADTRKTDAAVAATAKQAQSFGRLQAAAVALEAGQTLGVIPGAPPALTRFAQVAPPTLSGLRASFNAAANAARRASPPPSTDEPLLDRMWGRVQRSVTVRQGDHVVVGDPATGVLARARQALDSGDLAGAVHALADLPAPAQAAMTDWVNQAQSLLDARAALADMAAHG